VKSGAWGAVYGDRMRLSRPNRQKSARVVGLVGGQILERDAGDHIAAAQPAAKVDIGAAFRAEGAVVLDGILAADGAGHYAHSARSCASGARSRLRLISNRPIAVQPISVVSLASPLNAARRT